MAVLTGSRLSHVPDRAIAVSSAPMISAQISKYMRQVRSWRASARTCSGSGVGSGSVWRATRSSPSASSGRDSARDSETQQTEAHQDEASRLWHRRATLIGRRTRRSSVDEEERLGASAGVVPDRIEIHERIVRVGTQVDRFQRPVGEAIAVARPGADDLGAREVVDLLEAAGARCAIRVDEYAEELQGFALIAVGVDVDSDVEAQERKLVDRIRRAVFIECGDVAALGEVREAEIVRVLATRAGDDAGRAGALRSKGVRRLRRQRQRDRCGICEGSRWRAARSRRGSARGVKLA